MSLKKLRTWKLDDKDQIRTFLPEQKLDEPFQQLLKFLMKLQIFARRNFSESFFDEFSLESADIAFLLSLLLFLPSRLTTANSFLDTFAILEIHFVEKIIRIYSSNLTN